MVKVDQIVTSIGVGYVVGKGFQEAFSELYANAVDAVTDGSELVTSRMWRKRNGEPTGTMIIETRGNRMKRSDLLLGSPSQRPANSRKYIGKHREGMKIACLMLLRGGHGVTIETGNEMWIPELTNLEQYDGAEGMVWNIFRTGKNFDGVITKVTGVTEEDYREARTRCIEFIPGANESALSAGQHGRILDHEKCAGNLYTHGMYVCKTGEAGSVWRFGYDLNSIELSRDRDVPIGHMLRSAIRSALLESAAINGASSVYDLVAAGSGGDATRYAEYDLFKDFTFWRNGGTEALCNEFRRRHGAAIPVRNGVGFERVVHKLGALGMRCATVTPAEWSFLCTEYGDPAGLLEDRADVIISSSDVLPRKLELAVNLLVECGVEIPGAVRVAKFSSDNLAGLFVGGDVYMDEMLCNHGAPQTVLSKLIHEVAHHCGDDVSIGHVNEIERISRMVFGHYMMKLGF